MFVAITAQRAHELGCWADEDLRWRMWPRASVPKHEGVITNVFVRDLDLHLPRGGGGRRLEVGVDGLFLFGGAQAGTTLVNTVHGVGSARRRSADEKMGGSCCNPDEGDWSPEIDGP